ncbi:MAG: response regulator [Methanomicrobiales archaeon]|nr:response regulator [Methanomicrobiales archaeon]
MPQGSKILIVEDEMIISMEIKQKLKEMGYDVVAQAITGESAIQKAGEKKPDLVLMDIRLKGEMDGITAAKRIIELYNIPIIFLTAHSDKATLERAIAVSPSGYLLKPFKERELMTNIEMSLHKHRIKQRVHEEKHPEAQSDLSKKVITIPLPVVIFSNEMNILEMNQPAVEMIGFSKNEIIGKPAETYFKTQEIIVGDEKNYEAGLQFILPDQVSLKHKDGSYIPVNLKGGFILRDGKILPECLMVVDKAESESIDPSNLGPQIIRHMMALTNVLKLPAFVIDKGLMLTGRNPLFDELARKAGISEYMLKRPLYETPKFSFFGDMQDLQEIFRSGDMEKRIRKYNFGDVVKFIEFIRIPLKKDGVTTHIATIMDDVTNEKHALYEAEKTRNDYAQLYSSLENIRSISAELRTPLQDLLIKLSDGMTLEKGYALDISNKISDLMTRFDAAWVTYAEHKDQMNKGQKT